MHQTRQLHRYRRRPSHYSTLAVVRSQGTRNRHRVHSKMIPEIAIFVGTYARFEPLGYFPRRRETVLPIIGNRSAEQTPFPIEQHRAR